MERSRRRFICDAARLVACVATGATSVFSQTSKSKTRLILLGTGGGPRPRTNSYASSQVIIVDDHAYVIDCGDGVATQLTRARVPLATINNIFITHQHSDHNADYGNLMLLAWSAGLKTRVDTWGPPPLARMTRLFFEMNVVDIRIRTVDEGRGPLIPLVHAHEIVSGTTLFKNDHVTVRSALVDHGMLKPALAYRFDTRDRSIVISGDTVKSQSLIDLASGADVLVHEAMYLPGIESLLARVPNAKSLKQHLLRSHTTAEDAGKVAKAAGVKTLVLSHFVPADDPEISDSMWLDAARKNFDGEIIIGKDLMEI